MVLKWQRRNLKMNNEEIKITLVLNGEEAALIMAAVSTARDMLNHTVDLGIKQNLMPVVQMAREELRLVDSIIDGVTRTGGYESSTFVLDNDAITAKMERGAAAIKLMQDKADNKTEGGKDWDDAGSNVVGILDKFKEKEDKDET